MAKDDKIQWHPGFYGAAEIELRADREFLEFSTERELGKKPPKLDLLVIRKLAEKEIQNEIGKIFRKHNIVEYKSPEDELTIDTLFKVIAYAFLYKANSDHVDEIPADQLTVTLVRHIYPAGLFEAMEKYGFAVEQPYKGIYYTKHGIIPVQIIVTSELPAAEHSALRVLTKNVAKSDMQQFLQLSKMIIDDGHRENVDAVLLVSSKANGELFEEEKTLSEELREVFSYLFDEVKTEGRVEKGKENALAMLKDKMEETLVAKYSGLSLAEVQALAATL